MGRVGALMAAVLLLVIAIALTVDLLVSCWEQKPTPRRHVFLAVGLTCLLTVRIIERLLDGTL